jgi:hypothetical protein
MAKSKKKPTEETKAEDAQSDVSSMKEEDEAEEAEAEAEEEFVAPAVPAVSNAKVLQSLTDLVEYYVEMTIMDRRDRIENAQAADVSNIS